MKPEPWQTESDISDKRKEELKKCRATPTDSNKGIYAFGGVKLNRADVEWLLATHENEYGPVQWDKEKHRGRKGLDLRGADLRRDGNRPVDLSKLPLARLIAGPVTSKERTEFTEEQHEKALVQLEGASFRGASLEGANFYKANLEGIDLSEAKLEKADLSGARLKEAKLIRVQLESANLRGAQLEKANLRDALLEGTDLSDAQLEGADLRGARLKKVDLSGALLKGANLSGTLTLLENTDLSRAYVMGANLSGARLEDTNLSGALLEEADLSGAILKEVNLSKAQLAKINLREAMLESVKLEGVVLSNEDGVGPFLVDVQWGNTNLAVVDWSQVTRLGEAHVARQENRDGTKKKKKTRLDEYRAATRANRQLAVALQGQGLNEDAIPFAYAANALQRRVFWYQIFDNKAQKGGKAPKTRGERLKRWFDTSCRKLRSLLSYLFSHFLNLLAGYGYYPLRTLGWYLLTIVIFAYLYAFFGQGKIPLLPDALVLSFLSFHGRGFFPGINDTNLHTAVVKLSAAEAVVGLLIELSFVATFTQRYFGK